MTEIKLQLPGGGNDTFVGRGNIVVNYQLTNDYLLNPGGAVAASFNAFVKNGGQGKADGYGQNPYLAPIPLHRIEVRFDTWEGDTAQWGDANSDDSRLVKLQTLDYELNHRLVSSRNLAIFEHGEYSSSGKYNPLPVVVKDSNLTADTTEGPSRGQANITLLEAMDAQESIDAVSRTL